MPQQINAYYHPNLNEIVFPAAILQVRVRVRVSFPAAILQVRGRVRVSFPAAILQVTSTTTTLILTRARTY